MTIAVHRSVISSWNTCVAALGSTRVWGSPAGGAGIAMMLGEGLGLGLGGGTGDDPAAAAECRGGGLTCDWAVAHAVAASAVRVSASTFQVVARLPAFDLVLVLGIRTS